MFLLLNFKTKRFQFPSNGKADRKSEAFDPEEWGARFQFPSNGKADRKRKGAICYEGEDDTEVSIPFKRESGSQVKSIRQRKWIGHERVSIPFKRESGSQDMNSVSHRC